MGLRVFFFFNSHLQYIVWLLCCCWNKKNLWLDFRGIFIISRYFFFVIIMWYQWWFGNLINKKKVIGMFVEHTNKWGISLFFDGMCINHCSWRGKMGFLGIFNFSRRGLPCWAVHVIELFLVWRWLTLFYFFLPFSLFLGFCAWPDNISR